MADTIQSRGGDPIKQFSIFADNKVGRLNDLILFFSCKHIHVIALTTQDTTDSTIIRAIVDYPEVAHELLLEHGYTFTETELVAVEITTEAELKNVTTALTQAEINIHYIYSFIMRPNGKSALALRLEDNEMATEVLKQNGIKVLTQSDIAR